MVKIYKNTFAFYALTILSLTTDSCNAKPSVIFDLGGVLIGQHTMHMANDIGIRACLSAGSLKKARDAFFVFLNEITPRNATAPLARDEHGRILPQLMCDWLSGEKNALQISTLINNNFDHCPKRYKKFIRALTDMLFTPERAYQHHKLIPEGNDFVLACIEQGYDCYILSNWDPETFALIYQANPAFFSLFKGIGVSGELGLLKPDPAIYQALLTAYNLDPKECIFIDDQPCNIAGAQACGIKAIRCPSKGRWWWRKPDFGPVKAEMNAYIRAQEIQA